jgi:hypothetical protein
MRPTQAGPRRGQPTRAGAFAETPLSYLVFTRHCLHYSYRQRLYKKTLAYSRLRIGEVPDASALADAAFTGTGRLRQATRNLYDASKRSTLTCVPTYDGWRLGDQRSTRTAPP